MDEAMRGECIPVMSQDLILGGAGCRSRGSGIRWCEMIIYLYAESFFAFYYVLGSYVVSPKYIY
jgi:hypothetical protein